MLGISIDVDGMEGEVVGMGSGCNGWVDDGWSMIVVDGYFCIIWVLRGRCWLFS